MSRPVASCPNCGAPVEFRWSSAVQTVCTHCRSVLVRHDVDLRKVGEVADLPPDISPIRIGTTGRFDGTAFTVSGRIVYEYDQGTWNEWHLVFADGTSGWLSDAQAEYAVSRKIDTPGHLPDPERMVIGQYYNFADIDFLAATRTVAHYRGVEGELPFEYWDKSDVTFVDLKASDGHFATIDGSEAPPLVFVGRFVEFDDLALANLKPAPDPAVVKAAGFNCRNCGAAIELRAVTLTKTVACTSCGAIQDPSDPNLLVLQEAQARERLKPSIPLGSRGQLHGHEYEVIGVQRRTITVDDEEYGWTEYVLFNREHGFRYLSEYEGHWNDIRTVRGLPQQGRSMGKPAAEYQGRSFRLFQTAYATTRTVLGEFPWQVRAGDGATVSDYIAPPLMLSAERTADETTWSLGEYVEGRQLWNAFGLEGDPPRAVGVFANQPSPYGRRPSDYFRIWAAMIVLLLIVAAARLLLAAREPVFSGSYTYRAGAAEASFVTPIFEIKGRPSNLEVSAVTDLQNNWIYFDMALINADTGDALDFGREVSYYTGVDSDGAWSEGSNSDSTVLPTVAPGRYYLRVEPESDAASPPVFYSISMKRDVPTPIFYLFAFGLLLVPPMLVGMRAAAFEQRRWQESDPGGESSDSDDSDDSDGSDDD
jgi:Domain of unknown function (DUF4178)